MPKDNDPKDSAAEGDAGGDNPDDNPGTDKSKNETPTLQPKGSEGKVSPL